LWLGTAALLGVAVAYDVLLYLVRRADRAFPSTNPVENTWWFGYARDLANFFGMLGFAVGWRLIGFPGPLALLAGVATGLLGYGLDYYIARKLAARYAKVFLACAMTAILIPTVIARERFVDLLGSIMDRLF
jgi:uncharacterized membrane protein